MKKAKDKNAVELADEAIDKAGMPSVGRRKRGGRLVNILVLAAVAGIGGAATVMTPSAGGKTAKKARPNTEEVANHMPPLPVPDAPPALPPEPPPLLAAAKLAPPATDDQPARREPTWEERKLGFADAASAASVTAAATGAVAAGAAALQAAPDLAPSAPPAPAPGSLAARLTPTVFEASRASLLPDRNYILAAGAMLDCILDTEIDSTLPGMVKCHLDRDVYSDNKQVKLLDSGTELIGEQTGAVQQGQARAFVVFSRAKTPGGVIVNINSPATGPLGASGIGGWVDTQFGKRFGAAMMIALVQDAAAVAVARQSSGGGQNTLVLGNTTQAGGALAEKTLESTVNIAPVLHVAHGTHIQVMLARDLDFRGVYDLERTTP